MEHEETDRRPEFLARVDGEDTLVYVSTGPLDRDYYASFRVWVIDGASSRRVPVLSDVIRYRDGGSTYIQTSEGELAFPFGAAASWEDKKLTLLDPAEFTIRETDDTAEVEQGDADRISQRAAD